MMRMGKIISKLGLLFRKIRALLESSIMELVFRIINQSLDRKIALFLSQVSGMLMMVYLQ